MNGTHPVNGTQTPDFQWKRVENETLNGAHQAASIVFENQQQKQVAFHPERRLFVILIGNEALIEKASTFFKEKIGMPVVSLAEIRETAKRENGPANQCLELMKEKRFKVYPEEFPLGMVAKRTAQVDHKAGFIFKEFPKTALHIDVIFNVVTRKDDEVITYVFESEEPNGEVIDKMVARLEEEKREFKKINSTDPLSELSEFFNQRMEETVKKDKSHKSNVSLAAVVLALLVTGGISFFIGQQLATQGKE